MFFTAVSMITRTSFAVKMTDYCAAFRVHPRLITLYGEEVHEAESTISCSCI